MASNVVVSDKPNLSVNGARSRLYNIWRAMKARCYNPAHKSYHFYGGRGISVCQEWLHSFLNFRAWSLIKGYADHLQIDRERSDGNYEPSNCRWVTPIEQERNRRDNLPPITAFGETKRIWDWLEDSRCAVSRSTLLLRIESGRDPEWAMKAPKFANPRRSPHSAETRANMSKAAKLREEKKRRANGE